MAARETNMFQIKPPPPATLNKELLGLWSAWSRMGDREVVREAVVKGLHVDWAHTFLAARKGLSPAKIEKFFKDEVFAWVLELLSRRQVYKASHIMGNINWDPVEEFKRIFLTCYDPSLRKDLGQHLVKLENLEPAHEEAWGLLQIIEDKYELLSNFTENTDDLNVEIVCGRSLDWKRTVGTELFFKTYDAVVKPFVTSEYAWRFLLEHNILDLIKLWINIYFSKSVDFQVIHVDSQVYEQLTQMFLEFYIDDDMIEWVVQDDSNVSPDTHKVVLNELSKFGVFSKEEKHDLISVLSRVTDNEQIDCLYDILNKETSAIDLFRFNQMLIEYCVKNEFYSILNWCSIDFKLYQDLVQSFHTKSLDLICYLRSVDLNVDLDVGRNILRVSQFLCDDLRDYFTSNPLILISILLLRDDDLLTLFSAQNVEFSLEDFSLTPEVISAVVQALPFLNAVMNQSIDGNTTLNYHDLLKRHANVNLDLRLRGNHVPNFNSSALVERFGYKKTLNYVFYLKQARPSYARKMHASNRTNVDVNQKVLKLISRSFLDKEITAGCVAFLEMIGESSGKLRVYIKVAKALHQAHFLQDQIQDLLLKDAQHPPDDFLATLEPILSADFSLNDCTGGAEFIDELKKNGVAIKLARFHDLKLPTRFLEHCAQNNLWLPFLLYIQNYNYPLSEVQKLLQHFHNPCLVEHLFHGLSHDIQVDDPRNLLMRERDSRKYYLSRIGVRQNVDSSSADSAMHSSMSSFGSHGSTGSSSAGSDFLESEHLDLKTDLLQTLIRCHNSIDPPKALLQAGFVYKSPIFAVLATSYEPDSVITNWLSWLSICCEVESEFSKLEGATISAYSVVDLLKFAFKKRYGKVLHESLQIFLPDNPLRFFVDALNHCVDLNFDFDLVTENLAQFKKELRQVKSSTPVLEIDYEMMYLSNKTWIEGTAAELLATTLEYNVASQYTQLRFLKFLHDVHIGQYFTAQIPDFLKFYNILNYLFQSKCDINLDLSVIFDAATIEKEITSCIHELVLKKLYDCAFQIAKLQGMSTDVIIISEWQDKFISRTSSDFWTECNDTLKSAEVQGKTVVDFFEECSEQTEDKTERYQILNLAHKWATCCDLPTLYDVERKMWLAYFNIETPIAECDLAKTSSNMLYAEMMQKLEGLNGNDVVAVLSEDETLHLNNTVERLLNVGDVWQALRLAKIFGHKNGDLEVIILCCSLAEGFLMPYQMSAEQRILLNRNGNLRTYSHRRRRTLISSRGFSSISSASHSPVASTIVPLVDQVDAPYQDTLAVLETLVERVKNGAEVVQNILMTYRIAVNVEKTYQDVFKCAKPLSMLREALSDDCSNKLEVVHDFSLLFKWSKEQIAHLLCEELIISITDHLRLKHDPIMLWNLNLDTDFHLILQLLIENCSILGLKLYSYASALHKSQTQINSDFRISEINLIIELLIRSHDCFTTDCNMEGISTILRKSQTIISLLLTIKSWKLIVRLLTGVARYTEMNYVFHILRENDQFEFLLRKGSRKDNGLKVALLKYLKKYCPEDRELYRMVALHFTLFSEIAQLWEEEARSIIRNLIAISKLEMQNNGLNVDTQPFVLFTNTDGTKICLNKAMINYTHATEYHLQGEKLAKAMCSAKQAELVALQMSLLKGLASNSTAICILNVSDAQIGSLISTELSFSQSLILVQAYNYKADWANVLFEQFVINNHANYLDHFLGSFPATDTMVNDISRKFLGLKAISDTTTRNMKEIVNKCASVRTKYRIASELGFSDLVEDLLAGNQLAFLKDTVWKKGYKS